VSASLVAPCERILLCDDEFLCPIAKERRMYVSLAKGIYYSEISGSLCSWKFL